MQKRFHIGLALVSGIALASCSAPAPNSKPIIQHQSGGTAADMPLLSPRIFVEDANDTIIDLKVLREDLHDYVMNIKESIGVYFEYLPSGSSIGINSQEPFTVASLLKVPVVIKAYQFMNAGLISPEDKITMKEVDMDKNFGTLWKKGVGTKLTVRELIRIILAESDNTALQMMARHLGEVHPGFLNEVFDNLDIPKQMGEGGVIISVKNYTSVLRSLYLASTLPKKDAQEILTLLTQTKFNDKIPAGVPKGIPVAHKVGTYDKKDNNVIYSDCGIVYVPRRPYMLCMYVNAPDETSTRYMRDISKIVYEFISTADATVY